MIPLKEAFITKKNLKKISVRSYLTNINKKEFSTGDVVLTRNGNIGVIVFIKDIKEENLYYGIHVSEEYGSMIEPDLEETNHFSGLALNSYRDDGTSMWHEDFDIIRIQKKAISVSICKDPSRLYRELTSGKFDLLKESISEAFITKKNLSKVSASKAIVIRNKKSELQDGDLCLQKDNTIGVYNSKADFDAFNLSRGSVKWNEPTLIFYMPSPGFSDFQHYPMSYYMEDLKDKDGEVQYDVVKIIRGLFDPKDVNDPEKVKEFFKNTDLRKYF